MMEKERIDNYHRRLVAHCGMDVRLKINNNRSTMVSVRREGGGVNVSLHKLFLNAPQDVFKALVFYIKEESLAISPIVRAYMEEQLRDLDYSDKLKKESLILQGKVYDLSELYNKVNKEYFDNQIRLLITWFGDASTHLTRQVTFGFYYEPTKLIKIHRRLDCKEVPQKIVEFVIYHEMLHAYSPSYFDEKGVHHVHSKEFKLLEKKFKYYDEAQEWIRHYTR